MPMGDVPPACSVHNQDTSPDTGTAVIDKQANASKDELTWEAVQLQKRTSGHSGGHTQLDGSERPQRPEAVTDDPTGCPTCPSSIDCDCPNCSFTRER